MTKIQNIILQLEELNTVDLEYLLKAVLKKVEASRRLETLFDEYVGDMRRHLSKKNP